MKNVIFIIATLLLFSNCKKKETDEDVYRAIAAQVEACARANAMLNSPKGDLFVEGIIDGNRFGFTDKQDRMVLKNFASSFFESYNSVRAVLASNEKTLVSPAFKFEPEDFFALPYSFEVKIPSFRGDSLAYEQYKTTFLSKNATFPIGNPSDGKSFGIEITLSRCAELASNQIYTIHTYGKDQSGSFMRLVDIKEYKSGNRVFRRDLTFEFEANLYTNPNLPFWKRITKGKMVVAI